MTVRTFSRNEPHVLSICSATTENGDALFICKAQVKGTAVCLVEFPLKMCENAMITAIHLVLRRSCIVLGTMCEYSRYPPLLTYVLQYLGHFLIGRSKQDHCSVQ